jgi:hypothetical protein
MAGAVAWNSPTAATANESATIVLDLTLLFSLHLYLAGPLTGWVRGLANGCQSFQMVWLHRGYDNAGKFGGCDFGSAIIFAASRP